MGETRTLEDRVRGFIRSALRAEEQVDEESAIDAIVDSVSDEVTRLREENAEWRRMNRTLTDEVARLREENGRLRSLVESAYREGYNDGRDDGGQLAHGGYAGSVNSAWGDSDSRRALTTEVE